MTEWIAAGATAATDASTGGGQVAISLPDDTFTQGMGVNLLGLANPPAEGPSTVFERIDWPHTSEIVWKRSMPQPPRPPSVPPLPQPSPPSPSLPLPPQSKKRGHNQVEQGDSEGSSKRPRRDAAPESINKTILGKQKQAIDNLQRKSKTRPGPEGEDPETSGQGSERRKGNAPGRSQKKKQQQQQQQQPSAGDDHESSGDQDEEAAVPYGYFSTRETSYSIVQSSYREWTAEAMTCPHHETLTAPSGVEVS